mmetsp:Transcript_109277/g.315828  ORF Transcript_109277/g.315828 Transcript_109277/m.315828 type:complete len:318 (+) Transcript_109277:159-1112(+)
MCEPSSHGLTSERACENASPELSGIRRARQRSSVEPLNQRATTAIARVAHPPLERKPTIVTSLVGSAGNTYQPQVTPQTLSPAQASAIGEATENLHHQCVGPGPASGTVAAVASRCLARTGLLRQGPGVQVHGRPVLSSRSRNLSPTMNWRVARYSGIDKGPIPAWCVDRIIAQQFRIWLRSRKFWCNTRIRLSAQSSFSRCAPWTKSTPSIVEEIQRSAQSPKMSQSRRTAKTPRAEQSMQAVMFAFTGACRKANDRTLQWRSSGMRGRSASATSLASASDSPLASASSASSAFSSSKSTSKGCAAEPRRFVAATV